MVARIVAVIALAMSVGCDRAIVEDFQVVGYHLGDPSKRIKFVINGVNVGHVLEYGESTKPFEVEVVVGRTRGAVSSPSYLNYSTSIVLGVIDADTSTIFMTASGWCSLSKQWVTQFFYERRGNTDYLYCRGGLGFF